MPLFALRCEQARRELGEGPVALLDPDGRRVWQISPVARRIGVRPGLTISQAIGLCPTLRLCEPDPVHYDAAFARLLAALNNVSPVVEAAELGRAFVGVDGLGRLYGGPKEQLAALRAALAEVPGGHERLGWGMGKFVSWVAATRAEPGAAVIVPRGSEAAFLARQPLALLPLDPDTERRLRLLGLHSLGALAALPEQAVVAQFGALGRRLWRLAAGVLVEAVVGMERPEPVTATLSFFSPVADREMLVHAFDRLLERALADPRRRGWRVRLLRARAELERGGSWLVEIVLKDPTAERAVLAAPLRTRLDQSPPARAIERLAVEFAAFAPGTTALDLFARDATAAARAERRRALRHATREITLRLRRPMLYRIIEVQPWSRLPERRYALIDFES
ncbi:MAG TPA: hypothetical protein VN848_04450 [Gemmatimonadales bacterium]|nr:hypothetical protein [Gemmatimonadales bacterium]